LRDAAESRQRSLEQAAAREAAAREARDAEAAKAAAEARQAARKTEGDAAALAAERAAWAAGGAPLPPPALKGYAFQELLGRGGFSHVHRAVHVASSSSVAVKVRARVVAAFGVSSQATLQNIVPLNQPSIAQSPKYTYFILFSKKNGLPVWCAACACGVVCLGGRPAAAAAARRARPRAGSRLPTALRRPPRRAPTARWVGVDVGPGVGLAPALRGDGAAGRRRLVRPRGRKRPWEGPGKALLPCTLGGK
jgi:hypothetical protein